MQSLKNLVLKLIKSDNVKKIFILFLPLFFLPIADMGATKSKFFAELLCLLSLSFIYIFQLIKYKKDFKLNKNFHVLFISFALLFFLSAALNSFKIITVYNLFYQILVIIFLIFSFNLNSLQRNIPVNFIFYSGIIPALSSFFWNILFDNVVFSYSTFGNQNFLSSYIVIIASYFIKIKKNLISYTVFFFYIFTVFYSSSRNGMIGFLIIILFILIPKLTRKNLKYFFTGLILSFIILFILKFDSISRISSIEYRLYLNKISMNLISENLLKGIGSGNYGWKAVDIQSNILLKNPDNNFLWKNRNNITHAHNDYIELFCEYGLIIFIFIFILIKGSKYFDFTDYHTKVFLVLIAVLSMFSFPLRLSAHRFILYLFIISIFKNQNNDIKYISSKKIGFIFLPIVIFLFIFAFLLPFYSEINVSLLNSNDKDFKNKAEFYTDIYKGNINGFEKLAFLYVLEDDFNKFEKLSEFTSNNFYSAKITATKGFYFEKIEEYNKAEFFYKKAILSSKRYIFPVKRLVAVFLIQGRFVEAIDFLETMLRFDYTKELEEFYMKIKKSLKVGNR